MPPRIRFNREQIVQAALDIVREEGQDALNARAVAQRLGCSTQPIFREFATMAQLRDAVIRQANLIYDRYIQESQALDERPYRATGIAYTCFAREESELFKLLFMRDRRGEPIAKKLEDDNLEYILSVIVQATGLSREQAYDFHVLMWYFIHGLAVMIATHYGDFTQDEIRHLLTEQFAALRRKYEGDVCNPSSTSRT